MIHRAFILVATAGLGACASIGGDQIDPVEARLNALEAESRQLRDDLAEQQRIISGMSAVGLGSSVAALEEQFRNLRGELEQLSYESEVREERQRALYLDLDQRLQSLDRQGRNASGPAASAATRNDDQKAYLSAFQQMKGNNYAGAISAFTSFLQKFPASPYAANAQYWIGEAHYVQREFDKAWDAFGQVLARYPAADKAADALLKQALVKVEQGQPGEARTLLERLKQKYPSSQAAKLGAERLRQMGADG